MAAGATYEPIATTTLSAAAQSISFSSISSSYTDLRLVITGIENSQTKNLQFNGDTATNYSTTILYGNGTSALSTRGTSQSGIAYSSWQVGGGSTLPKVSIIDIFSYAGSTNKTVLVTTAMDLNGSGSVERSVGLWRSTSAITSLTVTAVNADSYKIGVTATLYGIKAA